MHTSVFQLDTTETFPSLARPPIVEAVIHWQARAQSSWEPSRLKQQLIEKLLGYSQPVVIRNHQMVTKFDAIQGETIEQHLSESFQGYRLNSDDERYVVQVTRDGLVFSQVKGYDCWDAFRKAGEDIWRMFVELAEPVETQRVGVRFINHIPLATPQTVGEFLRDPPTCPTNLPLDEFVYQSTFTVPGHPFGVRVIKVMQRTAPHLKQSSGLFLDIDVFTTQAIDTSIVALDAVLPKMRWLKNMVFFNLLTEETLSSFK